MAYRVPARRRSLDDGVVDDATNDQISDGPLALVLAGVIIVLAVQAFGAYVILVGHPATVLQEQSTSAFVTMLTLGAIGVFILPGIFWQVRQLGRRR
jgi:hypothetical protein